MVIFKRFVYNVKEKRLKNNVKMECFYNILSYYIIIKIINSRS